MHMRVVSEEGDEEGGEEGADEESQDLQCLRFVYCNRFKIILGLGAARTIFCATRT